MKNNKRKKPVYDNDLIKEIEGSKENIFANSIISEMVSLIKRFREIKISEPSENTIFFLCSPDMQKEIMKAKIDVLNKILIHLP